MLSAQTGTHLALGIGSAERGLGSLRAVRFRDGRRSQSPRAREKEKEERAYVVGERIRDRASAWDARSIFTTGDTKEHWKTQRNTRTISDYYL